jgi:DNA-binding HxlR family transcriptional regulator/putative sterol carrier protein
VNAKRTYEDDGCAAAHALDLIGERWALLVVRELLLGPKRFSDLQTDLPHISPNMLSQRLKDLERIGAVYKYRLPPPAASQVYALTPWGYELEPILQSLGRWGARSPELPKGAPISLATLITAFKTMFHAPSAHDLEVTLALRIGADRFALRVHDGMFEVTRGEPPQPDATLGADVATFGELAFAGLSVKDAVSAGRLKLEGNANAAERFTTLFQLPEPVSRAAR